MSRNFGVKRHQYQPIDWRMRLGDAFAVFDNWPMRLVVGGIAIASVLLMASCAQARPRPHRHAVDAKRNRAIYLPHPQGCPATRFCCCGASVHIFGHPVSGLNLCTNWLHKFARTSPAPGMVAVRSGHGFVLESHIKGLMWMVTDYNSGGHQSRLHARSIAGYTIVNPHGGKVAMR